MRKSIVFIGLLIFILLLGACSNNDKQKETKNNLSAGSGSTGGVYYPFMGELGTILTNNIDIEGFDINVNATGGSVENIAKIINGDFQIALGQNDLSYDAINGVGDFEGKKADNIGVIASLFPEVVQVVTLESTGIESIEELKGKKVGIGAPGGGNNLASKIILEAYGIGDDDYTAYEEGFSDANSKLQNKTIDAAIVINAVPASILNELQSTTKEVKLLELNDKAIDLLKEEKYDNYTLESDTYDWQKEPLNTVAMMGMLITDTNQVSDELAYEITKALFENSEDMKIPQARLVSKETAFQGVGDLPLHPGAKKYYEEEGLLDNYEGEK